MGGTIAFEMAQQLHAEGQQVGLLALFDTYNWSKLPTLPTSLPYQVYFLVRNLLLLDLQEKFIFLRERVQWAKRRISTRITTSRTVSPK